MRENNSEGVKMLKMFARLFSVFVVLMLWAGWVQGEEKKDVAPLMEVETPMYEFAQVVQGEVLRHDFRVFNRGNAELTLEKVSPD